MLDTLVSWLIRLSDSQVRAFRHTSTLAGKNLTTCRSCAHVKGLFLQLVIAIQGIRNKKSCVLKDVFQSVLRSLGTLMFVNIINSSRLTRWNGNRCYLHIPYLWDLSNSFSSSFIAFFSCEVVSWSDMRKNEVLSFDHFVYIMAVVFKLWNLLHVSSCKMFTFVVSYMKQNKKTDIKQTLESAQYRLEISFRKQQSSVDQYTRLLIHTYSVHVIDILSDTLSTPDWHLIDTSSAVDWWLSGNQLRCIDQHSVVCLWNLVNSWPTVL